MIFKETTIQGAYLVELEKKGDERGFFARLFCVNEYKNLNLDSKIVQINNSYTKQKHTLRGLHYQLPPNSETRIVRCLRGGVYDVTLDLRPKSPTFGKYFATELTAENRNMVYIPKGCAHGFMTLEEDTEFFYLVTEFYSPEKERIIRWNDPKFNIKWPFEPVNLSKKDSEQKDFEETWHLSEMETL